MPPTNKHSTQSSNRFTEQNILGSLREIFLSQSLLRKYFEKYSEICFNWFWSTFYILAFFFRARESSFVNLWQTLSEEWYWQDLRHNHVSATAGNGNNILQSDGNNILHFIFNAQHMACAACWRKMIKYRFSFQNVGIKTEYNEKSAFYFNFTWGRWSK